MAHSQFRKPSNTDDATVADLSDAEVEALHEVELGVEWLHRAHGHLAEFHHVMDRLASAEDCLRGLSTRCSGQLLQVGVGEPR